jgi:hypothetical protein
MIPTYVNFGALCPQFATGDFALAGHSFDTINRLKDKRKRSE